MQPKRRVIVGVSGASGIPVAVEILRGISRSGDAEAHLVYTRGAQKVLAAETDLTPAGLEDLAGACYGIDDLGAAIASGTYRCEGMIIAPCSMKTVAGVAGGYSDNLLLRAADVTLKERRKLVMVVRESPLSAIHLRNMLELCKLGAYIQPMTLAFYNRPLSVDDLTRHVAGKALEVFGIPLEGFRGWKED